MPSPVLRIGALKLKAQVFCGEEGAMGPGRAELLKAIDLHGSISAAGRALGMSYRYTWLLVDSMNRCFRDKLVETSTAGAKLTAPGREALAAYRALEAEVAAAVETGAARLELERLLREAPLPAASKLG